MKNTELFYRQAKTFQDKRAAIMDRYGKDKQALERYKGSQGYAEELEQIETKHKAELKALVNECRPGMQTVLKSMLENIGSRTMPAPTTEQVNLLNVLKMKEHVTVEDCQRVAEAVKDNPLAVSVVTDIAHEKGILQSFDNVCTEMSSKRAGEIVTTLSHEIEDFLQHDTTRASRLAQNYAAEHYGNTASNLTKRQLFTSEAEFYSTVGLEGETLQRFSEIVDKSA